MTQLYLIALNRQARGSRNHVDLAVFLEEHFPREVRIVERGYGGKSVTVEMADGLVPEVLTRVPFATVELAQEMNLL